MSALNIISGELAGQTNASLTIDYLEDSFLSGAISFSEFNKLVVNSTLLSDRSWFTRMADSLKTFVFNVEVLSPDFTGSGPTQIVSRDGTIQFSI